MYNELNYNIKDFLYQKYDILYHTNFLNFDKNYELLYNDIVQIKKDQLNQNEKIIIEQFDTDFYDYSLICGLHNRNVIECIREADIPFFVVIFVTNNYNLEKELELLINKNKESFPIVLKTISSRKSITDNYKNKNISLNFKKIGLCMLFGVNRSHRDSLYHYIKNKNLFKEIAVSYNNE
jgi:hypothetical protein